MKSLFLNKLFFSILVCLVWISSCSAQEEVIIGTWNLEHFGRTKLDSTITFIAKTVSSCDVVAIQEVVGKHGGVRAVKCLTAILNEVSNSNNWKSIISDQTIGNSDQDERYAFVWNDNKGKLVGKGWLDQNYASEIVREPYLATFRFSDGQVTLVNFHAVPPKKTTRT